MPRNPLSERFPKDFPNFGIDTLEIYARFNHLDVLEGVDIDNSNSCSWRGFVLSRHEVPKKYLRKIMFSWENWPVFAWYEADPLYKAAVKARDYLCIYAAGFKLLGQDKILSLLDTDFALISKNPVRRLDVALDISGWTVDRVLSRLHGSVTRGRRSKVKRSRARRSTWQDEEGNTETYYIGEYSKTKNHRQLVRIYDKVLDTRKKMKHALFPEYALSDSPITRVEVEFRRELTRNIVPEQLFDYGFLLGLLKHEMEKHTGLFKHVRAETVSLFKRRLPLDPEFIQSKAAKEQRVKMFMGLARSVFDMGFCPVDLLILEGYVQPFTKHRLGVGRLEDYIASKHLDKYWEKNILANFGDSLSPKK